MLTRIKNIRCEIKKKSPATVIDKQRGLCNKSGWVLVGAAIVTAVVTTTLDIIIRDSALSFLDAGLQFSDAVTDGKTKALLNALRPTVCVEENILGRRIVSHVFLQEVRGTNSQVEAVLQPRLLDA